MIEYVIINDITGLMLDSFSSEELAFTVMTDYQKDGYQCHLEAWRR
ncbi:MAG: hypothetical protein MJZ11_12895 [Lachnospiraceae bacterium]|nr:hypothetical protein [Lachnospiraceae bacterium]